MVAFIYFLWELLHIKTNHFNAICGGRGGGGVCRGSRTTTSFGPQRELPPARLVIHRQTSAHAPRKEVTVIR